MGGKTKTYWSIFKEYLRIMGILIVQFTHIDRVGYFAHINIGSDNLELR